MTTAISEINRPAEKKGQFAAWWERAITPKVVHPDVSVRSTRLVAALTLATLAVTILFGIILMVATYPLHRLASQNTFWAGIIGTPILLIGYVLNRRGHYYTASIIILLFVMLGAYLATTTYRNFESYWTLFGITASSILFASIIFPQRKAVFITTFMVVILALLLPLWQTPLQPTAIFAPLATTGIIFSFTYLFSEHRNQLEQERQASLVQALQVAERLAAIVESTSDFVASAHMDGQAFYVNNAGRRMVGLGADASLSKMTINQLSPQWANAIISSEGIPTALRAGTWTGETALLGADGAEIPASQTIIAHKNPDGSPAYLSTIVRDVSQQKRAAEERERLIKDLQAAKRLAEENSRLKSEFLSMMSHELRTPLNAIEGFTGVILKKMGGTQYNEKTEDFLNRVQSNSRRLLQLINDFLDLSRVEAGRLELANQPFAPARLAERWRSEIGVLADKKGLTFDLKIDATLPETLIGDEEAISKIVINLLSNAIKFTEQGGVILALERRDAMWIIAVTDTGIGIPPHAREFIFEEFRQVDQSSRRKFGGTGLGLSIVQKYTRSMGGSVGLKSEVGHGSTFTITLPIKTTV